ncbi:MAG: GNAT family N-acetyltransferase [Chloroflexi bacterium]|nr:GNAT family N-acetyltransferase [Chloroflexota bacterium]
MIQLVPMNQEDFQSWLAQTIQEYATEKVQAGNWPASKALELSRHEFQSLLPDGLASKDQHLFTLLDPDLGEKVGMIWFAVLVRRSGREAFIYDFVVFEPFRRRGYGAQALLSLEEKVKELDIHKISLHVFGHNHAARALYKKVGYVITNIHMSKDLDT